MALPRNAEIIRKAPTAREDRQHPQSALAKYRSFFIGDDGWSSLLKYELVMLLASGRAGALGYLLRKKLFAALLYKAGPGVQWGKNISLRHPGKMEIGEKTAIDDNCLLDARGVQPGSFRLGCQVLVARNVAIQSKTDHGFIDIGDHCSIGNNSTLSSAGGIRLGAHVMLAGHCYIGGGRYDTTRDDLPMMEQPLFTRGPVEIGSDCWLGAGARVLDGSKVGPGSVIGAAALVTSEIPPRSIAVGVPARVVGTR